MDKNKKYLYVKYEGGFNDILCQIERTLNYCINNNRILMIDIINATAYNINFNDFFNLNNDNIICDYNEIINICKQTDDIYPGYFKNKLLNILSGNLKLDHCENYNRYGYSLHELPNNINETILIHNAYGGGNGYNMFKQLNIKIDIKNKIIQKYNLCDNNYLAIHIRNTDYKNDYIKLYEENINLINSFDCIFLATDDINALNFFKSKHLKIINFTQYDIFSSCGLHMNKNIDPEIKMIDILVDIYIFSQSYKILSTSYGGFNTLLKNCYYNKKNVKKQFEL